MIETNTMTYWEQIATYGEPQFRVDWDDPRLATITRLRLLSDPGFPAWDVSYCTGKLKDGTAVDVNLPFHQLGKRSWKREIIEYAKEDKVYAKGLGIFEAISQLC